MTPKPILSPLNKKVPPPKVKVGIADQSKKLMMMRQEASRIAKVAPKK